MRWLGLVLLMGCGAAPVAPPPPPRPVEARKPSVCERVRNDRARVDGLLKEGKLDRARRVIEDADARCPKEAGSSSVQLGEIRRELGLDGDPISKEEALTWVAQGLTADGAQAQRLFDRALVGLRAAAGKDERIVLFEHRRSVGFGGGMMTAGHLGPDEERVLVWFDQDRWRLPARVFAGESPRTTELGLTYDTPSGPRWQPRVGVKPLKHASPIVKVGHRVVAFEADKLVLIDARDGSRVAERTEQMPPMELMVRGDMLVEKGYPGWLRSWSAASLEQKVAVDAAAVLVHPTRPLAVTMGKRNEPLDELGENAARAVDLRTGKTLRRLSLPLPSHARWGLVHAFDPAGERLAILSRYTIVVVNLQSGARIDVPLGWRSTGDWAVHFSPVFSEDGRYLCAHRDSQTAIVDLRARRLTRDTASHAFACFGHHRKEALVFRVPLSPGYGLSRRSGEMVFFGLGNTYSDVVVDDDVAVALTHKAQGKTWARELVILERKSGRLRHRITLAPSHVVPMDGEHLGLVDGVAWAGAFGITPVGYDVVTGTVVPGERPDPPPDVVESDGLPSPLPWISRAKYEVRGTRLLTWGQEWLRTWDLAQGVQEAAMRIGCHASVSENGRHLVTTPPCGEKGPIVVTDVYNGRARKLEAPPFPRSRDGVNIAVTDDGSRVAASMNLELHIFGRGPTLSKPLERADLLAWTPKNQLVVVQPHGRGTGLSLYTARGELQWDEPAPVSAHRWPRFSDDGLVFVGKITVDLADGKQVEADGEESFTAPIVMLGEHRPMAMLSDGRVARFGDQSAVPGYVVCRVGDLLLPYEVCEERWREDDALR